MPTIQKPRQILVLLALALCSGCAARERAYVPTADAVRFVEVHSAPTGWVELDENFEGTTPATLAIATRTDGHPWVPHAVTVRDASGAWDRRMLMPQYEVPRVMVYDMRDITGVRQGISMAR